MSEKPPGDATHGAEEPYRPEAPGRRGPITERKPGAGRGIAALRRRDRGKNDGWIRAFLREVPFGFLATVHDGEPFLNSNLFVYVEEDHALYFHTARTGRTPENVAQGGRCSFSAASMGRFLPADTALEFGVEYCSVVAFGNVCVVSDPGERRKVLERIMEKYAPHLEPGRDYRPITDQELRRTAVHRMVIDAWSGKELASEPGFPGAYDLPRPGPPFRPRRRGS